MLKKFLSISFVFLLSLAPLCYADAQSIGLLHRDSAFLSLEAKVETSDIVRYKGHLTTYDQLRGFIHSPVDGVLRESKNLTINVTGSNIGSNYSSEYFRDVKNKNTIYRKIDHCFPNCEIEFQGFTLRSDASAKKFLEIFERNTSKNAVSFERYKQTEAVAKAFCDIGLQSYCFGVSPEIGVVLDQSEAGLASLVASAIGAEVSVATYAKDDYLGAVVATSPQVIDAIYNSTKGTLSDGVIDARLWSIVQLEGRAPDSFRSISIDLKGEDHFLGLIHRSQNSIDEINAAMGQFFSLIPTTPLGCRYGVRSRIPFLDCFLHSSEIGVEMPDMWLRMFAALVPKRHDDGLGAEVFFSFSRKFDSLSMVPDEGNFSQVDFTALNEVLAVNSSINALVRALQKHFQSSVTISR